MVRFTLILFAALLSHSMRAQVPQIMWYFDVNDASFGNSALADLDGDGKPEVAFSNYRNDSNLYVLNMEDGSLLWKFNTGGCNDVAPLILDTDGDGDLEIVLPSSCVAKTFCLDGDSGYVEWMVNTHGSDSPPSTADLDNDGKPEILHGEFGGYVICLNAEDGSQAWEIAVDLNSWIQTAPAIMDVDNNGQLDFVVGNWSFGTNHRIWAFRGDNHQQIWDCSLPTDYMYHGSAFHDIDKDGYQELTIGDYNGNIFCLNAENGGLKWGFALPDSGYAGAPTSMGDLDLDGWMDIVFVSGYKIGALDHDGNLMWSYSIPGYATSFRGTALADMDNDDTLDVVFGTSKGHLMVIRGTSGALMYDVDLATHYGSTEFDIDHGPVVGDFDKDGDLDVFLVGGHAEYPTITNNWGRAYALSFPSALCSQGQVEWPMFRHDERRSGCYWGAMTGTGTTDPSLSAMVYPNPGEGHLTISLPDHITSFDLAIHEITGSRLTERHSCPGNSININIGKPGIYVVTLTCGELRSHHKVVVR